MDASQIIEEQELQQVVKKPAEPVEEVENRLYIQYIHGYTAGYEDGNADGKDYWYYTGAIHALGLMCGITAVTYMILRRR